MFYDLLCWIDEISTWYLLRSHWDLAGTTQAVEWFNIVGRGIFSRSLKYKIESDISYQAFIKTTCSCNYVFIDDVNTFKSTIAFVCYIDFIPP